MNNYGLDMCVFPHVSKGVMLALTSNYEAAPVAFLCGSVVEVT